MPPSARRYDETPAASPAEQYLRDHVLWEKEHILYAGAPGRRRAMRFNFWFCPVGLFLLLLCFLIWWNAAHWGSVRLPEILVVLGALWLASSPLRYARRAMNTAYFVTDQRAIILEKSLFRVRETVFYPEDISDFRLVRRALGRGDLRLRLSRSRIKTPYQEDKEKWIPQGQAGFTGLVSGATPFSLFNDGFWDVADVMAAAEAIKKLNPAPPAKSVSI